MVHPALAEPDVPSLDPADPAELGSWLAAIAEITRAANRDVPLDELLDLIAGANARLTGYDFCAVMVADLDRQVLLIKGSYGLSQEYIDTINARAPVPLRAGDTGEGPSSRAFRSQRPTTVLDIAADPASRSWEAGAAQQGYSSLLSVPIVVGQEHFGLLNCYTAQRHHFSAREIILMESMANQAGLAIDTARRLAESRERAQAAAEDARALRAELGAQRQADENHLALLRVVLEGGGLAAIADSLAPMLGCTIVIDDDAGRVLATADSGRRPGGAEARATALYERARALVDEQADVEAIPIPAEEGDDAGLGGLVVPVTLDETVGHLWALHPGSPFGRQRRQALARAAAVIALALLKERTAQEVEWRLSRDFFDDLFDADGQASETLHARALQLGADLSEPHTVLVVRRDPDAPGTAPVRAERAAYAQRSLLALVQRTAAAEKGVSLVATRSDHVVVLWKDGSNRSALEFAEHLRRETQAYAGGWTATVSVGPSCRTVQEYGDAYRLACGVLDLVQQAERHDRVVSLEAIGAYRLLLQVKRPRELQCFADSMLGPIRAYDQQHHTKLGDTLSCYMAHRCVVSATAAEMHVHQNTVAYRLRRVEELLGVDLADPQAMLHLQLALMVERILGAA